MRIRSILLVLLFLFIGSSSACGDEACGSYRYVMLESGTIQITAYRGTYTKLILPDRLNGYIVSAIGSNAFYANKYLEKVTVPDSVTVIG